MLFFYRNAFFVVCILGLTSGTFVLEELAKKQNPSSCSTYDFGDTTPIRCTGVYPQNSNTGLIANNGICTFKKNGMRGYNRENKICVQGVWRNLSDREYPKRRRVKRFLGALAIVACFLFCPKGGSTEVHYVSNSSPTITCPEIQAEFTADPMKTSHIVTWSQPTAMDKEDGANVQITQTGGNPSGSEFPRGIYTLSYLAQDRNGGSGTCQRGFSIKVVTCPQPAWPQHGTQSCNHNEFVYGSTCTFTCNEGFELSHTNNLTCELSGSYDHTPPTCSRTSCQPLTPPINGEVTCTNVNFYGSVCTILCDSNKGFSVSGPITSTCQADKIWSSVDAACEDTEGPSFTYCPNDISVYADQGQTSTSVSWKQPQAVDNNDSPDDITIQLTEGQMNASRFEVGIHGQKYVATDKNGNESPVCQFNVIVQELFCNSPDGIFNDTFIYTRCLSGFRIGSSCEVYCSDNYQLIGNVTSISCEKIQTDIATWQWGDQPEPTCNSDICPDLTPPLNGALACKQAGANEVCTMACNNNYDVPRTADVRDYFICSNDGEWTPSSAPDCTERKHPTRNVLPGDFYYFAGDCSDAAVQNEIKSNFVNIMKDQPGLTICPPDDCSVEDVKVTCGDTSKRKRKRKRKTTPQIKMSFKLKVKWQPTNGTYLDEFNENENKIMKIWEKIESLGSEVAENISGVTFDSSEYGWTDAECTEKGTKAVYSSNGVSCSGCPSGTFYYITKDDCVFCPKGTYQDEAFQKNCKNCPPGTSTAANGTRNETQCIETCKPGFFSTNGLETCAPCPRGMYQPHTASTGCEKCDTSTTTTEKGSISLTNCTEFDVLFNTPGSRHNLKPLENRIDDFTFGLWISCPSSSDSVPVLRIQKDGETTMELKTANTPKFTLLGKPIDTPESRSPWSHYAIQWNAATKTVTLSVNGIYNNHVLDVMETNVATAGSNFNIEQTIGAAIDCKMSGFYFINKTLGDMKIVDTASTCYPKVNGALYTMEDFKAPDDSPGFQLITPSKCDGFDDCKSSPCGVHKCYNLLNGFKCQCIKGYTGDKCEVPPDYCKDNDCLNGATCKTQAWNYTCNCLDGYRGPVCQEKIVDGQWSDWTSWGACSVTCGSGVQFRHRNCSNPPPDPDGKDCTGYSEEQQSCATDDCPQCPSSTTIGNSNNVLKCKRTGDFQSCEVSCRPGFVSLYPPKNPYYCGANSSHVWAPERQTPACTVPESPDNLQIQSNANMDGLPCSADSVASIENNLQGLSCVKDSLCNAEVTMPGCNPSSRKRRSATSTMVSIVLYIDLQGGDNLNLTGYLETGTMSDGLKNYIDSLKSLEATAQELNSSYSSIFNVSLNGITYEVDASSFNMTGNISCPSGSIANDGSCVDCVPGTKQVDSWCTWCNIGTYQDAFAQTECVACPEGFTTKFLGSTNITDCSEPTPSTTTNTAATYINTSNTIYTTDIEASASSSNTETKTTYVATSANAETASTSTTSSSNTESESTYTTSSSNTETESTYTTSSSNTEAETTYTTSSSNTEAESTYTTSSSNTETESTYTTSSSNTEAETTYTTSSSNTEAETTYTTSSSNTETETTYTTSSSTTGAETLYTTSSSTTGADTTYTTSSFTTGAETTYTTSSSNTETESTNIASSPSTGDNKLPVIIGSVCGAVVVAVVSGAVFKFTRYRIRRRSRFSDISRQGSILSVGMVHPDIAKSVFVNKSTAGSVSLPTPGN